MVETGTARDPHHFACLIGFGATAVYPYLAYQTLHDLGVRGILKTKHGEVAQIGRSYRRGVKKGLLKIISKMGISTIGSYRGAQLFEIIGLDRDVVDVVLHRRRGARRRRRASPRCRPMREHLAAHALECQRAAGDRRPAQVRAGRRVPPVQSRRGHPRCSARWRPVTGRTGSTTPRR